MVKTIQPDIGKASPALILNKYRLLFHMLFWFSYILTITFFFGEFLNIHKIFIRTLISTFFNAIVVYLNLYVLLPRYFEKKKYWEFLVFLNGAVLAVVVLRAWGDTLIPKGIDTPTFIDDYLLSLPHFLGIALSAYVLLLLTSSAKFIKDYFMNIQMREQILRIKYESELRNLKNQLNPHFLFNTLNNIYSYAYLKSDKAGPMILMLSDMMRYVLYECDDNKVPMSKELDYLGNYIELQKMKKEAEQKIGFEIIGDFSDLMIEPLLFLPLFENVFKHGNLDDVENGWMKAKFEYNSGMVMLDLSNSYVPGKYPKTKDGGIGLRNIKERLNILYPGKHGITIVDESNVFSTFIYIEVENMKSVNSGHFAFLK